MTVRNGRDGCVTQESCTLWAGVLPTDKAAGAFHNEMFFDHHFLTESAMNSANTPPTSPADMPKDGNLADWVDEKTEALRFELGEKFPVPPTVLHSPSLHIETSGQKLEEVLLEHEEPTPELLAELAALAEAPPVSDEELARQALADGGADGDVNTAE